MNFQGQNSLITGGSSGIGLALAKKLAAQGANIWLVARDRARLEAACEEVSAARKADSQNVTAIAADVSDEAAITSALEPVIQAEGAPDLVVNSAGITQPGHFIEQDMDIFRSMMEVNYFGTLHVIKAVLPGMTERGSGHIVNISSIAGFMGVYGYSAYGASKFAVRGLSDSLHYELADKGIRVSVVFPPDTQTPQLEYETPFKPPVLVEIEKSDKVLSAEQVADAILKGVARGKHVITPGSDSSLYFNLTNFFGLVYPVMGFMVAQARKVVGGSGPGNGGAKNNGGEDHKGNPDQV